MPNKSISIFKPSSSVADDFFDSFFKDPYMYRFASQTELDVYEDKDNVWVELKAPGFGEDEIKIQVEDNMLSVSGKSEEKKEEQKNDRKYYYKEIRKDSFARSINLPVRVKADEAKAEFDNGVLKIRLPKAEEAKPKMINISAKKK